MQKGQATVFLGVEPSSYFTPKILEDRRYFRGWQFYGLNRENDKTECGVVSKLEVRVKIGPLRMRETNLIICFGWLSSFRTQDDRWIAVRENRLIVGLENYDGAIVYEGAVPYFFHKRKTGEHKPVREFGLFPAGYFEGSEHRGSWQLAEEAYTTTTGWLRQRKLSSKNR